jgi:hypothetical protein
MRPTVALVVAVAAAAAAAGCNKPELALLESGYAVGVNGREYAAHLTLDGARVTTQRNGAAVREATLTDHGLIQLGLAVEELEAHWDPPYVGSDAGGVTTHRLLRDGETLEIVTDLHSSNAETELDALTRITGRILAEDARCDSDIIIPASCVQ